MKVPSLKTCLTNYLILTNRMKPVTPQSNSPFINEISSCTFVGDKCVSSDTPWGTQETITNMELTAKTPTELIAIGDIYDSKYSHYGIKQNRGKAVKYYKEARNLGSTQGKLKYANALYHGHGVKPHIEKAKKIYTKIKNNKKSTEEEKNEANYYLKLMLHKSDPENHARPYPKKSCPDGLRQLLGIEGHEDYGTVICTKK